LYRVVAWAGLERAGLGQESRRDKMNKKRIKASRGVDSVYEVTDDDGARRDAKETARVHKANAEDGEEESGKDRRKGGKEERTDELEGREARRRKRELGWALKGRV
jgi:hypothetical protein